MAYMAPRETELVLNHPQVEVLVITALKEELDAVKAVDAGAMDKDWAVYKDSEGFNYFVRRYQSDLDGRPILVAVAQAVEMGVLAAGVAGSRLIHELRPHCLAMCGICAGRRSKVALGDVIVADRIYKYDDGKMIARENHEGNRIEELLNDIKTYNLDLRWKQAAEHFPDDWCSELVQSRPPSLEQQQLCLLERLSEKNGISPSRDPESSKQCPSWSLVVRRLREQGLITKNGVKLIRKGQRHLDKLREEHPGCLPQDRPFRVHVGPIATGSQVVEDGQVFARLAKAERDVLGLEMEAAAIGMIAEVAKLPWMIVVKGVADHADLDKDDAFHPFAARAAAELLLAFLCRELPSPPWRVTELEQKSLPAEPLAQEPLAPEPVFKNLDWKDHGRVNDLLLTLFPTAQDINRFTHALKSIGLDKRPDKAEDARWLALLHDAQNRGMLGDVFKLAWDMATDLRSFEPFLEKQ